MDFMNVEWISVNDSLPEDGQKVMVAGYGNDGKKKIGFTVFERKSGWKLYHCDLVSVYFWVYYAIEMPEFDDPEMDCYRNIPIEEEEIKPKSFWQKLLS